MLLGKGALTCGLGIVEVELRGRVLLVEGRDSRQITLGLAGIGPGLGELRAGFLHTCAVYLRVDYEQGLPATHERTFLEKYPLQISFDTCADFDKLLRADAPHIFTIYVHIPGLHRLHLHNRQTGCGWRRFEYSPQNKTYDSRYHDCCNCAHDSTLPPGSDLLVHFASEFM